MPFGADAIGLPSGSHEGRPTKIEGNPDHPASLGGTDVFTQLRFESVRSGSRADRDLAGEIRTWSAFLDAAQAIAAEIKAVNGAGFRILTGTVVSPSIAEAVAIPAEALSAGEWHQWEPAGSDGVREGAKLAFGRYVSTVYRPEKADVILSLDSDFLASGPGHIRYMKEFYRRRKLDEFGEGDRRRQRDESPLCR